MDNNLLNCLPKSQHQIDRFDFEWKKAIRLQLGDTSNQSKVSPATRQTSKSIRALPVPPTSAPSRNTTVITPNHITLGGSNGHLIVVVLLLVYIAYGPCSVVSAALPSLSPSSPAFPSTSSPSSINSSFPTPLPYPFSSDLNPTPVLSLPPKLSNNLSSIITTQIKNNNHNNNSSYNSSLNINTISQTAFDQEAAAAYQQNSRFKRDTKSNQITPNIETNYDKMSSEELNHKKTQHMNKETEKVVNIEKKCHKAAVWKCGKNFVRSTKFLKYTTDENEKFNTKCILRKTFFNCLKLIKDKAQHCKNYTKQNRNSTNTNKFPRHLADSLWESRNCIGAITTNGRP